MERFLRYVYKNDGRNGKESEEEIKGGDEDLQTLESSNTSEGGKELSIATEGNYVSLSEENDQVPASGDSVCNCITPICGVGNEVWGERERRRRRKRRKRSRSRSRTRSSVIKASKTSVCSGRKRRRSQSNPCRRRKRIKDSNEKVSEREKGEETEKKVEKDEKEVQTDKEEKIEKEVQTEEEMKSECENPCIPRQQTGRSTNHSCRKVGESYALSNLLLKLQKSSLPKRRRRYGEQGSVTCLQEGFLGNCVRARSRCLLRRRKKSGVGGIRGQFVDNEEENALKCAEETNMHCAGLGKQVSGKCCDNKSYFPCVYGRRRKYQRRESCENQIERLERSERRRRKRSRSRRRSRGRSRSRSRRRNRSRRR